MGERTAGKRVARAEMKAASGKRKAASAKRETRSGNSLQSAALTPYHFPLTRPARPGFTLIEMLTVIAIIGVLAGISMMLFKYANTKAINGRTKSEIKALETAIEQYKLDTGIYPVATNTPRTDLAAAKANSKVLFRALSGNSAGTSLIPDTGSRQYFNGFVEGKSGNVAQDSGEYYIVDPNRNAYNYISGDSSIQTNKITFDVWSFGIDGVCDTYDDISSWNY